MSNFASHYQPEDYTQDDNFKEGDYRLKIIKAEATTSRNSGKDMIVVECAIQEAKYTFRYYLVDNEYFNANATKLFDCFKMQRGNFDLYSWIGRYGKGHIAKGKAKSDGKQYWELAYLIVDTPQSQQASARQPAPQAQRPAPQAQRPAPQPQRQAAPQTEEFTDDIPF